LIGRDRGALLGVAAFGPFGLGLLASSIAIQRSLRTILAEGAPTEMRLGQLRAAVSQSTWLLGAGTMASVVACVAIAIVVRGKSRAAD